MTDLRADETALERGGLWLVHLHGQLHVVGHGYLCMVDGYGQGIQLMERILAEEVRGKASISQPQDSTHAT